MSEPVIVATIGAVGVVLAAGIGIVVELVRRGHRRNTLEHEENAGRLDAVLIATGRIEQKLDDHLDSHREGTA